MKPISRVAAHAGLLFLLAGPFAHGETPSVSPAPAAPASEPNAAPATPSGAEPAASPTAGGSPTSQANQGNPAPSPAQANQPAPAAPAWPAHDVPPSPRESVDALSDGDTKQALDLIRANYLDSEAFSENALNRATLQGILDRLGAGAEIVSGETSVEPQRFLAEILDDRIGYVRLGTLSADSLAELDAALGNFAEKNLGSLILDLRATPPSRDFETAAEVIKRFTPKGKLLFAVRRPSAKQERMYTSSQDPAFTGVMATVVSRHTSGAAEVIAAVLRTVRNGMVVGQTTAGEAAEFTELPLRGGKKVRVAVGEVNIPGDLSIFPGGMKPDLAVEVPAKLEVELLRLGVEKGVSGLVFETERARLNEAALVAQTNPELDEVKKYQKGGYSRQTPYDATLQRAVDLITTINIFTAKPGGK